MHGPSELEAAVLANPADRATALVYADWLLAQGDPRGELIVLLAGEDADQPQMRVRRLRLERELGLGPGMHAWWKGGFLTRLRLEPGRAGAENVVERLRGLESRRFFRTVSQIEITDGGPDHIRGSSLHEELLRWVSQLPQEVTLEGLSIGSQGVSLGPSMTELSRRHPRLRRLTLRSRAGLRLDQLVLPELRRLVVITRELYAKPLSLTRAYLPEIRELYVDIRGSEPDRSATRIVLSGEPFPRLRRLGLWFRGYDGPMADDMTGRYGLSELEAVGLPIRRGWDFRARLAADPRLADLEQFAYGSHLGPHD